MKSEIPTKISRMRTIGIHKHKTFSESNWIWQILDQAQGYNRSNVIDSQDKYASLQVYNNK